MFIKRMAALEAATIAVLLSSGVAYAQVVTDHSQCRAGTASVLAQDEKNVVTLIDHRGINQAADPSDPFHGSTQRCFGVIANFGGKSSGNGWCKQVHPQTGDWAVLEWVNSSEPGKGTWTMRHGVGKWKGISGGGTYESLGRTRPVEAGTYQNCIRVKGTISLPG